MVGAFRELRGAREITQAMARDCEARIAALSALVVTRQQGPAAVVTSP